MEILKTCSIYRPIAFLSMILLAFLSFSMISCSKDGGGEEEEGVGGETFAVIYRIVESSRFLTPNILEIIYTNAKGETVKTDYEGFGLEKVARVTKPFNASFSVKAQNTSTTETAQILLQISVGQDQVEAVEFVIEPNTTLTQQVKYTLR